MSKEFYLSFPLKDYETVKAIEKELHKKGITFDTGCGFGMRNWELDFSLSGTTPEELIKYMETNHPSLMKKVEKFEV